MPATDPATPSAQILPPRAIFAAMLLGATIAFVSLNILYSGKKTNFEDAATFGAQTTAVFAKVDGNRIHCSDVRDAQECIAGAKRRNAVRSVLWLGNSQVHAVNQLQPGQTNSTPILFAGLKRYGLDLVTFSQPNANLQEHYVLFEYLRQQLPVRILILPLVFDDMREEGLRDDVAALARDAAELSATEIGRRLVTAAKAAPRDSETAGIAQTAQEGVERYLNSWLEKHSTLWQSRPQIRGELLYGVLYNLRNSIFGIKPTTKRKMVRGRYLDNTAAMEAILAEAKKNHIRVIAYIAPFRGSIENPYDDNEYAHYKAEMESMSGRYGAQFANLESLVPEEYWGVKDGTSVKGGVELDFMHFQAAGHGLLAQRLEHLVIDDAGTGNSEGVGVARSETAQ